MHFQHITGDTRQLIKQLDDDCVDLVLTDPAYASLSKHRAIGTTTRLKTWFEEISNDELSDFVFECYRVLRPDRHCLIMTDQESHYIVREAALAVGFTWHKFVVWDKENIGGGYHFRARHELICFMEKGKRKVRDRAVPDVLRHKKIYNGYPTEKPVSLSLDLIKGCGVDNGLLLDAFAGSGSISEAGLRSGMNVLSLERESKCAARIHARLNDHGSPGTLFVPRRQGQLFG